MFREKKRDGTTVLSGGGTTPLSSWPVGSIYMSMNSTNPNTIFGGGTWARVAQGRVIVGVNESDSDFSSQGLSGGEKTHKLTVDEMPLHQHAMNTSVSTGGSNFYMPKGGGGTLTAGSTQTAANAAGGDGAHNNLQPYLTCYIWQRTA